MKKKKLYVHVQYYPFCNRYDYWPSETGEGKQFWVNGSASLDATKKIVESLYRNREIIFSVS